jgi:hypothetical protein
MSGRQVAKTIRAAGIVADRRLMVSQSADQSTSSYGD